MNRRTRLTLYSDASYFGGAEGYLLLLARHLDPDAFALSAVLPDEPGAKRLEAGLRAAGVSVHHLKRPGFRWFPLLPEMIRVLRRAGGEVLHMNLPSSYDGGLSSLAWAARQAGYRWVVTTEHLPMIQRKYRKFPTKAFFSHWIDRAVVVAEANRSFLERRHGIDAGKIRVIPNGVEDPPSLPPEERRALRAAWGAVGPEVVAGIVGQITLRKGHHILLEALSRIRRERPDLPYRLVVVGQGEEEEKLRRLAELLGVADCVVWLGFQDQAPRLMRAFDLFVLPSFVEAMPLTVLEAMAAGIPVVATSVYGLPEVVRDGSTGFLVPPGDAAALVKPLVELFSSPPRRTEMGRAGRARWEERFTAGRMVRETAALYLEGGSGHGGLPECDDGGRGAAARAEEIPAA